MAAVTVKLVDSREEWESFLTARPEANFLQSWLWGDFYERLNKAVFRSGFYDGNKLVGVMLCVLEPARRGRYLAVAGGPILDWQDRAVIQAAVNEMKKLAKANGCVFVRVRPQLLDSPEHRQLFKSFGLKVSQMHLEAELTSQLDITKSEDELMANFRKNTRYELRQAIKNGIKIKQSTDPDDIDGFYDLQLLTAQRHGFVPFKKAYLKEQFRVFAEAGQALLYSSYTKDNKLIAQAFIIFYGQEAAYHYGASTDLGRSEPGAYLMQWQAIKEAKKRGQTRYNFWGVVEPDNIKHRFYGVSVFKRGFRGEDVEYLHAHDLIVNKLKYLPNLTIEYVRKRRRHL